MKTFCAGTDAAATLPQPWVTIRLTFFALALGILGACTTMSDAERTRSFCERQRLDVGTAQFQQCVANKQAKMDHERAIDDSDRYKPPRRYYSP